MAQFTSYSSGGTFSPLQLTDDSERILRQADDLIKKQSVLSEFRSKQSAALANNLNVEFERSKRQRDENSRRRKEQVEINYKIQKAEGDQALAAATQQARLDDAFKQQKDAQQMQAFAGAAKAFSSIATTAVKDGIEKAIEQGASDALAASQTKSKNTTAPILDAEKVPDSEVVGQVVRDGIQDSVTVAQANETRLEESEADTQTGGREFGLLQRMFGVERAYNTSYRKEQNLILGKQFKVYESQAAMDGNIPVVVTVNGVEQQVMYGDAMLDRNPVAKQEAMSQLVNRYAKENGIDSQDPVMAQGFFKQTNAFMNEELNQSFRNLDEDLKAKQTATFKADWQTSNGTRADLAIYTNKLVSRFGVAKAKEIIDSDRSAGIISAEELADLAENDSWFPGGPTIAESDGAWLATTQYNANVSTKNRVSQAEAQRFEKEVKPLLKQVMAVAVESDGFVSTGDTAVGFQKILPRLRDMGLSEADIQKAKDELSSMGEIQRNLAGDSVYQNILSDIQTGDASIQQIQDNAAVLGEDRASALVEMIQPGATAQLPEGLTAKDAKPELMRALTNKLIKDPSVDSSKAHESIFAAYRTAEKLRLNKFRSYVKDGMSEDLAAETATADILQKISSDGDNETFGTLPGAEGTGSTLFPAFTRNTDLGSWSPTPNEDQLNTAINQVNSGEVPLNQQKFLNSNQIQNLENQIITGKTLDLPGNIYALSTRLGVPVEELVNSQLEAYGKTTRLSGQTPITAVQNTAADPTMKAWIPSFPTQANVQASIALTGNYPRHFQSGNKGYQQVKAAANTAGGDYPDLTAAMWAAATNYGTTEAFITDESGNKMAAGSPKEYVEWANNIIKQQKEEGGLSSGQTYAELIQSGALPESMEPVLRTQGLLDQRPTKKVLVGASETSELVVAYITGSMTHGVESTAGEHLHVDRQDNPNTPDNEALTYLDQHDKMMNESILIETGKGTNKFLTPKEWVDYTSSIGYPETGAQRYGASRDGGSRQHKGYDFRSEAGSKIKLRNGARIIKVIPGTSNGDHVIIQFKDGSRQRLLHGKFSGVSY